MRLLTVIFLLSTFTIVGQTTLDDLDTLSLYNHWVLKKEKEGNQSFYASEGGAYNELILNSNGTYKWKSVSDSSGGDWQLKNDTLGLFMTEAHGQPWNKSLDYSYRWIIVEVNSTKLILKILGRHGFVFYYYEPSK